MEEALHNTLNVGRAVESGEGHFRGVGMAQCHEEGVAQNHVAGVLQDKGMIHCVAVTMCYLEISLSGPGNSDPWPLDGSYR